MIITIIIVTLADILISFRSVFSDMFLYSCWWWSFIQSTAYGTVSTTARPSSNGERINIVHANGSIFSRIFYIKFSIFGRQQQDAHQERRERERVKYSDERLVLISVMQGQRRLSLRRRRQRLYCSQQLNDKTQVLDDLNDAHWGFEWNDICVWCVVRSPTGIFLRKLASDITLQLLTKRRERRTHERQVNEWTDDFIEHKHKWLHYSICKFFFCIFRLLSLLCSASSHDAFNKPKIGDATHSTYLLCSFEVDNYVFHLCPCDSLNWLNSSGALNGRHSWILLSFGVWIIIIIIDRDVSQQ